MSESSTRTVGLQQHSLTIQITPKIKVDTQTPSGTSFQCRFDVSYDDATPLLSKDDRTRLAAIRDEIWTQLSLVSMSRNSEHITQA